MGQTDSDRAVERCCCTQQSSVAGVRNEIWMTCFTIQLTKRTCAAIGGNQRADFARDHRLVASLARHGQVGRDGATERHHHDGVFVIDVGLEDVQNVLNSRLDLRSRHGSYVTKTMMLTRSKAPSARYVPE